ncbi:MAG: hypothetical protein HY286_10150 [Planctomycetes bacterium]|nr:hypothetical protein [Planctomycetota bacterium]
MTNQYQPITVQPDNATKWMNIALGAVNTGARAFTGVNPGFSVGDTTIGGAGGNGGGPDLNAANAQMTELLNQQFAVQQFSLYWSTQTNIVKTDHDTRMNAVRNIRP